MPPLRWWKEHSGEPLALMLIGLPMSIAILDPVGRLMSIGLFFAGALILVKRLRERSPK